MRRIAQEEEERHGIDDARDPAGSEGEPPAEGRVIGHVAGEAAEDNARVDARLVDAHRPRPRRAGVEIGDERERGRNVEGLADAHDRAGGDERLERFDVAGDPRDGRPDKEACHDDEPAARAIGHVAAQRAQDRVDPLERPEHDAPVGPGGDVGDVGHDRRLHRREHLPVEVIQERHRHEQRDDDPGQAAHAGRIAFVRGFRRRSVMHAGRSISIRRSRQGRTSKSPRRRWNDASRSPTAGSEKSCVSFSSLRMID